jgi:hypothetical protein
MTPPSPSRPGALARLLGVDLTAKLLIANTAIVVGWAVATWLVAQRAAALPSVSPYELLAAVVAVGILLSLGANLLVLRSALAPLRALERVARAVQRGEQGARARPGAVHDRQTDRVIAVVNGMLDALEAQRA